MTDLAESSALGYGYKSSPAACGLRAHQLQLLPKRREGFDQHLPSGRQTRMAAVWDLEIKGYKNIAKDGEESEQSKQ